MDLSITIDPEDKQILALYITLDEGQVHKTIEIAEGECYADEDADGNLIGVEMIAPGELHLNLDRLATKCENETKDIEEVIRKAATVSI